MKPFFLLLLLVSGYVASSQVTATLTGHIDQPKGRKVYVRQYRDYLTYSEITVDSGVINKKGDFKMTFDWPQPGPITFYHGDEITEMYLCPGDDLHLYLDTRQFDETLIYKGIGSDRNAYCAQKMLETSGIDQSVYKSSAAAFSSYVDSIRDISLSRLEKQTSSHGLINQCMTSFLNFERAEIEYQWAYSKMEYPMMYRYYNQLSRSTPIPEQDDSFLQQVKIDNPEAMLSTWYVSFLTQYIDREVNKLSMHVDPDDRMVLKEKYVVENFKGPVLDFAYAEMIYDLLTLHNDTLNACPMLRRYKGTIPDGKYAGILDSVVTTISKLGAGNIAPDFTATDAMGKSYSLHDFKGKFVYLDIWATWCGPCVGEIPAMEKLIEMFEGEDVAFISVSVDDDQ
jgi:hypothetical protein